MNLTDRTIRALQPKERRYQVSDSNMRGLALRVSPDGVKSWSYRYRVGRRLVRLTLGTFPKMGLKDARDAATDAYIEVRGGADPARERKDRCNDATVRELFEEWVERHASKRRTGKDLERVVRKEVPASWWRLPAREIRPRDVMKVLDGIVDRGAPYQANRVRAYLSSMFKWGIPRDLIDNDPTHGVPLPHHPKVREADPLTAAQLRKLWSVLTREHPVVAAFYRLRLLTLQRGRQVRLMKWADLEHTEDGQVGEWWTAPGTTTKTEQTYRVYLSPLARREIERLRPLTGNSEWVLPSPRQKKNGKRDQPLGRLQKASTRIRDRAGLPKDWARDFRLTGTSWLTEHGVDPDICDRVLGHQPTGLTGTRHHYDRYSYDGPKRAAVSKWGERVIEVLQRRRPEAGKVVELRSRR